MEPPKVLKVIFGSLILLAMNASSIAGVCHTEDFEAKVSGEAECLLMRRYGSTEPATIVVWLHGNMTSGNPANYHFSIAEKAAVDFASEKIMSVALVRPGYPDGSGESSSGNDYGRGDNWNRANIAEVGAAIERLRLKYKPKTIVLVGHSGGAATAAVLMGMKPKLAEAAILVSCPCDLVAWRVGRARWARSENPIQWSDKVNVAAKIIALTGTKDSTTSPEVVTGYIKQLKDRGVDAIFQPIPDVEHANALESEAVSDAVGRLLHR